MDNTTNNNGFAAIDFETATHQPHSACSIGVVLVDGTTVTDKQSWLIRPPDNQYWSTNTTIHKLTAKDTKDAEPFDVVWREVHKFIDGRTLVAHNSRFDAGVLKHAASYRGLILPDYEIVDSKEIGGAAYPKAGGKSLKALTTFLDIELDHHEALSDAHAAAQIVIKAANDVDAGSLSEVIEHYDIEVTEVKDAEYFEFKIQPDDKAIPAPIGKGANMKPADGMCPYETADGLCGKRIGKDPHKTGRCARHR